MVARLSAHYRDTETGASTRRWSASRCSTPAGSGAHAQLPAERSETRPLGRHLDGCRIGFDLGGSDRKVAAVVDGASPSAKRRCGTRITSRIRLITSTASWTRCARQRRTCRASTHRRQRRRGVRQQRVKAGSLFRGVPRDLFQAASEISSSTCAGPGTTCRSRSSTTARSRRWPDRCRWRERHSRHRTRHQHRRRLRHAGRQHHLVAERAGVRARRLQPVRASRRVVGRLRRRLADLSQQAVGRLMPAAGSSAAGMGLPERLKAVQKDGRRAGARDTRHGTYSATASPLRRFTISARAVSDASLRAGGDDIVNALERCWRSSSRAAGQSCFTCRRKDNTGQAIAAQPPALTR